MDRVELIKSDPLRVRVPNTKRSVLSLPMLLFVGSIFVVFQSQQIQALTSFGLVVPAVGIFLLFINSFWCVGKYNFHRDITWADFWLTLFSVYIVLRALLIASMSVALHEVMILILTAFGLYFGVRIVLTTVRKWESFVVNSLGLVVVSTISLYPLLSFSSFDMRFTLDENHTPVAFSQVIVASGGVAIALLYWSVFDRGGRRSYLKRSAWISFGVFSLLGSLVLAWSSGTRSTFVALAAVIIVFFSIHLAWRSRIFVLSSLLFLFTVLIFFYFTLAPMLVWLGDSASELAGHRLASLFYLAAASIDGGIVEIPLYDLALDARAQLRDVHWWAFYDHFWFGAGPSLVVAGPPIPYPHNLIVELLAYYGILGALLFLLFLLACVKHAIWLARRRRLGLAALIGIALASSALVQLQFSFSLWMAKPLFVGLAILETAYLLERRRATAYAKMTIPVRMRRPKNVAKFSDVPALSR